MHNACGHMLNAPSIFVYCKQSNQRLEIGTASEQGQANTELPGQCMIVCDLSTTHPHYVRDQRRLSNGGLVAAIEPSSCKTTGINITFQPHYMIYTWRSRHNTENETFSGYRFESMLLKSTTHMTLNESDASESTI